MNGSLGGYVVAGDRTVVGAAVTILSGPGRAPDVAPMSDADGWFTLDNLAAGRWRLQAHAPDGTTGVASVDVWEDSLSEVTIVTGQEDEPGNDIFLDEDIQRDGPPSDDDDDLSNRDVAASRQPPRQAVQRRGGKGRVVGVKGRVSEPVSGRPVADVLVVLTDAPGPLRDRASITDEDGKFSILHVEPKEIDADVVYENSGQYEIIRPPTGQ